MFSEKNVQFRDFSKNFIFLNNEFLQFKGLESFKKWKKAFGYLIKCIREGREPGK